MDSHGLLAHVVELACQLGIRPKWTNVRTGWAMGVLRKRCNR